MKPLPAVERVEDILEGVTARVMLSALILLSVLPDGVLDALLGLSTPQRNTIFLLIFGTELVLRLWIFEHRRRQRLLRGGDLVVLALDLMAVVSFLPLSLDTESLRFLRLGRLMLVLSYWRGIGRELWLLISQPERRFQVLIVVLTSVFLAFVSAVVLLHLHTAYDFDGNGTIDAQDQNFVTVLWWSFRQVQDAGNLVSEVDSGWVMPVSLALTFSGLLLFSFFIGIGTTVVEELVARSRSRRVDLRGHTVVLGLTPYSSILFRELAEIYRKNLRPFRGAVLADEDAPEYFTDPTLRGFRYRRGLPSRTSDLDRVDISRAKRVLILGEDSSDPDAGVLSALLATRDRNPTVNLYPDLEHERNFPAARAAGGPNTYLVGSGSLLGYYLAQNVAYPGIYNLYRQLLRSSGCEIYTYMFSDKQRRILQRGEQTHWPTPLQLWRQAQDRNITLIGLFTAEDPDAELEEEDLDLWINPMRQGLEFPRYALDEDGRLRPSALRGLIGIALRFSTVTELAEALLAQKFTAAPQSRTRTRSSAASDGDPETTPTELPHLTPDRRRVERVLILGAGPRMPRVVRELVGMFRRLQITVLARADEAWQQTSHDARIMLADAFDPELKLTESDDEDVIRMHLVAEDPNGPPIDAHITCLEADWTHRHVLEGEGAVTLGEADVILLLLDRNRGVEGDGSIALDALHLANLDRTGGMRFKPGVHVVALVRDPDKGRLLERRLVALSGSDSTSRYTVIARETARHRFLMQSVFVRGLNTIYLALLSSQGQFLSRLLPRDAAGEPLVGPVDLRGLAERLLTERGVIFIGLELQRPSDGPTASPPVLVDPAELRRVGDIDWQSVVALYVLGAKDDVL